MANSTSERLQILSPRIMDEWVKRTCSEIEAANQQEKLALRNSLPIYLTQLVDALSKKIDRTAARKIADKLESTRIGQKHGNERAHMDDYTMDQLIMEYHILRQVICDVLEEERPLTPVEREVIVCSVEQAVNDAATEFSETVNDLQNTISNTLAHDLRNPLSIIKISAELINKRAEDVKGSQDKSHRIMHTVDRIDKMIKELLDASLLKLRKPKPQDFKECDLDWLVQDVAFEINMAKNDQIIVKSLGKCLGRWSEEGLRRVIENLITNAIKYGSDDPVTITVEQDNANAVLKVHNLGDAIPLEEQSTLFGKFKRAKAAKDKIGWGLGLTVVKAQVDDHDGTITLESTEVNGTTFTICLPKKLT